MAIQMCITMHTFTFYIFRYTTCHIVSISFFRGGWEGEVILWVCTQDAYVFWGFYFFRNKFLKLQRTLKIGVLQFLELWKCITSNSQEIWFSITLNTKNIKRKYCQRCQGGGANICGFLEQAIFPSLLSSPMCPCHPLTRCS